MPATRPLIRRAAALAAAAGAVALSVRALSRPRPEAELRLVDWETVRRTARARSGQRVRLRPEEAARLAAGYDVIAAEMVPLMAEVCGTPPATIPRITVLDRHGFIDANLLIVQRLLEPVERLRGSIPETAITAFGRRLTSRYVGEVLGFMSQRVLGQYDPVLMLPGPPPPSEWAPSSLYLVEPNVELLERGQGAPAEPLRRWLVLHEATHAWQFEAHPWLRPYIGGLMNALLASGLGDEPGGTRTPSLGAAALRRLGRGVAGQLRGIGQLQAVMSVLEGYSNLVMHRVGRGHIEGFDDLEEAFHRRQAQRTFLERLILALTGIALKLRQYDLGERFAEALLAEGGYSLLNRVWEGPEMMPTMAEVRAPDRWIARARRHGGARRRSAD
ncbi:MAG: zinc-dependent metalloprotease [Candidatus Dormibacteria bacterium]